MILRFVAILAVCGLVGAMRSPCPEGCICSTLHYHGSRAMCKFLDPTVQSFPDTLLHLDVEDCPKTDLTLTQNYFVKNLNTPNLVSIRISNCSLVKVESGAFDGMPHLELVDLSYNHLRHLDPRTFESVPVLKRLILRGNVHLSLERKTESKKFLYSESLIELVLADSNIVSIPPRAFSGISGLEYLDLSGNLLTVIGNETLASLVDLVQLNLSHNSISRIHRDAFADIGDLTTLYIQGNPIKTLEGVEISGLTELDASSCSMEDLSSAFFEGLPELNLLKLSNNEIMVIDEDTFTALPALRYLDLSNNNIRSLSKYVFEKNQQIETINLSGNRGLQTVDGFAGQFPLLYRIDLSMCGLTSIPASVFQNMNQINKLNLSGNAIQSIDSEGFSALRHLTVLDLSNNELTELSPHLFKSNRGLQTLNLGSNKFKHVPAIIFQATPDLATLDLSNNRLVGLWNISEAFVMRNKNILGRLSYLNVSGNKLKKLHMHSFISTGSLDKLDISNNPIECTPDFSHVMQWLIVNRVMPSKGSRPSPAEEDLIKYNIQWDDVLKSVCPGDETISIPDYLPEPIEDVEGPPEIIRIPQKTSNNLKNEQYNVDVPIEVEPLEGERDSFWPMTLVWVSMGAVALALTHLTFTLIIRSRRRYAPVDFSAPFITPPRSGVPPTSNHRSLYTKLYEECSAPAVHQPKTSRLQTIFRLPQNY